MTELQRQNPLCFSATENNDIEVSVVVPVLNEEETIPLFIERVNPVMDTISECTFEYLFIDGGSTDRTAEILKQYRRNDPRIKIITLSRSFGKEASLFCGLKYAAGKVVIPMDVDLQDPPEVIPRFLEKWREGYEIVYGTRQNRNEESFLKRFSSRIFYRIFNVISEQPIPRDTGDFRLMSRNVVAAVLKMPERTQFMKEMFHWVGFRSCGVLYERPNRIAGTTKWNYWKLWNFALDGLTASTTLPLRIWTYIGLFFACIASVYILINVTRTVLYGIDSPGYPTLLSLIVFFGAMQMISSGIQGEYIGRILKETKQRPIYIIANMDGVETTLSINYATGTNVDKLQTNELQIDIPQPNNRRVA
ncbi:MAG: glycosyltransferase family 2 protein [Planctomycetaceae bacterium]|jgi:glycosyltransferase involved in cell wall biosynthesis|nr:glycosyltransferase family 2 protein [Planctomycetaceae bacterium]